MQAPLQTAAAFLLLLFCAGAPARASVRLDKVVIDPGHGGKDPGAISKDGKSYEKTFVLDISKILAEKIRDRYPEVEVILTRSTDVFVPLGGRADIANGAGADLFMSIHINSSTGTAAHGYSVHVLGQSHRKNSDLYKANLDVVRRENSVITLDEDYNPATAPFNPDDPESYIFMTMVQSAYLEQSIAFAQTIADSLSAGPIKTNRGVSQDPFYVLWKTSMPAVLVELGFISNSSDLSHLQNSADREAIAERLFRAFAAYKTAYDETMSPDTKTEVQPQELFGVQIATLSKPLRDGDSRLMGYKARHVPTSDGKHFRCIVAVGSEAEARSAKTALSKRYPDCFLVRLDGEKVSRVK